MAHLLHGLSVLGLLGDQVLLDLHNLQRGAEPSGA